MILYDNYDLYDDTIKYLQDLKTNDYETFGDIVPGDAAFYELMGNYDTYNIDLIQDVLKHLDKLINNGYIFIADLGLWSGRRIGYMEADSVLNIPMYDYTKIEIDRYNLTVTTSHHDGTNDVTVREWKDDISEKQRENFTDLLYTGKATKQHITRYTKSVKPKMMKILGF